jgi:hypothetical protein
MQRVRRPVAALLIGLGALQVLIATGLVLSSGGSGLDLLPVALFVGGVAAMAFGALYLRDR